MLATRQSNGPVMLGELPGSSSQTKIEVWSRPGPDGEALLELVEYSWGSGLGWYVQRRLTLEAAQVEAFRLLLGGAPETQPFVPRMRRSLPPIEREENVLRLMLPAS